MSGLLIAVVNMSLAGGLVLLPVMLLRLTLKKLPKRWFCLLWAIAALRLVVPFSVPQAVMFRESPETTSRAVSTAAEVTDKISDSGTVTPEVSAGIDVSDVTGRSAETAPAGEGSGGENPVGSKAEDFSGEVNISADEKTDLLPAQAAEATESTVLSGHAPEVLRQPLMILTGDKIVWEILALIWAAGILTLTAYAAVSCLRLHRIVKGAVRQEDGVYCSGNITTPFLFGVFRPKIYLPADLAGEERKLIIAHEQAHRKRLDHLKKPLAFLILTVHWFNPLVWAACFWFCRDVELACDESVLLSLGQEQKKAYAGVLLQCSTVSHGGGLAPLAFGETAVKERIRSILHYRQPSVRVTMLCALLTLTITAAACVVTNPVSVEESESSSLPSAAEESPGALQEELTEHEKRLLTLQEEMYEPPLSRREASLNNTKQKERDQETLAAVDQLCTLCTDESWEELDKKRDALLASLDPDGTHTKRIKNLLTPGTERIRYYGKEKAKRQKLEEFREQVDEAKKSLQTAPETSIYSHAADDQLLQAAVLEVLLEGGTNYAYGYNSLGFWYGYLEGVILGDIQLDSPRITLSQVSALIEQCYDDGDTVGSSLYGRLCQLQKYPDVDFAGSGVAGSYRYYLAAEGEVLYVPKGGSPVLLKTGAEGIVYSENLMPRVSSSDIPMTIADIAEPSETSKQGSGEASVPAEPSEFAVSQLKFLTHTVQETTDLIHRRYPNLTQEQLDQVLILYDLASPYGGSYAYQVSLTVGKTDPSAPKLTLPAVKEIIRSAKENPNVKPYPYQGATRDDQRVGYYIWKGISEIQYYPDWVGTSNEFWLDGSSRSTRTEEITVDYDGEKVEYRQYDTEGNLMKTETLFDIQAETKE